jgi:hypothetical protein
MLTKEQEWKIKIFFEAADKQRLLHGPGEEMALYLHGVMLGLRETLESKGIELKGVTGTWWYENLDGEAKRQKSTNELIDTYGMNDELIPIMKGKLMGEQKVLEVLNEPNFA